MKRGTLGAAFAVVAGLAFGAGAAVGSRYQSHPAGTPSLPAVHDILAGTSPETGEPFYTTADDAPGTYEFREAKAYCASLGDGDTFWRLPTRRELSVLFQNRATIGGFNESGSLDAGWYWSASEESRINHYPWVQRFSNGLEGVQPKDFASSLRCVRG
jgi:hypothetical protein